MKVFTFVHLHSIIIENKENPMSCSKYSLKYSKYSVKPFRYFYGDVGKFMFFNRLHKK